MHLANLVCNALLFFNYFTRNMLFAHASPFHFAPSREQDSDYRKVTE